MPRIKTDLPATTLVRYDMSWFMECLYAPQQWPQKHTEYLFSPARARVPAIFILGLSQIMWWVSEEHSSPSCDIVLLYSGMPAEASVNPVMD